MPEPARAGADDQQRETPITVDLAQRDAGKAVTRALPGREPARNVEERTSDAEGGLTKGMSKRIARMQRSFDQQLAEQQALHQRELSALRGAVDKLSVRRAGSDDSGADDAAHERVMNELQAKLEEAQEKGESKEVARLTREMSQADAKFWAKKTQQALNPEGTSGKDKDPNATATATTASTTGAAAATNSAARRWTEANDLWWEDPEFAAERGAANGIHQALMKEGSDPNTDAHYVEVTNRLQVKFPKLPIEMPASVKRRRLADELGDDDLDDETEGARRRSPVRSAGGGGEDTAARRGRLDMQLDAKDQATMRSIGWDPSNDKHVLLFANSKRETIEAYEKASA